MDSVLKATTANSGSRDNVTDRLTMGRLGDFAGNYVDGTVWLPRVLPGTVRTADWILARYNNINSPSTFYTIT